MQTVQILNEATGRFKLVMSVLFHSESDELYSNRLASRHERASLGENQYAFWSLAN